MRKFCLFLITMLISGAVVVTSCVTINMTPSSTPTHTPALSSSPSNSPNSTLPSTPTTTHISRSSQITAPISGIDLDVTYISREPRYDWKATKKWPSDGEPVVFTAHIVNNGSAPSGPFTFRWLIDNTEVANGVADSVPSQQESTQTFNWKWASGRHYVSLQADPQNQISEVAKNNNSITDTTDALTLAFWVEQSVYNQYNSQENGGGTYSWEDWAQTTVQTMNRMFERSVYPLALQGVLTRVRLDNIEVVPDGTLFKQGPWHAPSDTIYDGRWGFSIEEYLNPPKNYYDVPQWVIHELGHYLFVIFDLYALDVQGSDIKVLDDSGKPIAGTPLLPYIAWDVAHYSSRKYDVMHVPDPNTLYSDYHVYRLNRNWPPGQRKHDIADPGDYATAIPSESKLRILDNNDSPIKNVEVSIFQSIPGDGSSGPYSQSIDNTPDITGTTDAEGFVSLGNKPFGNLEKYGTIASIGLVRLKNLDSGLTKYAWIEFIDWNLAYWRGDTKLYIHDVHFPEGLPQLHLDKTQVVFSTVKGQNPIPQNVEVQMLGEGVPYWTISKPTVSWLMTIPSLDIAASYPPGPLTLIIDSASLPVGSYTTQLSLGIDADKSGPSSSQEITVTLTVSGQ